MGDLSSTDADDYDDAVQLDDTAGAQNERRDVARPRTTPSTSLKHLVAQPGAAASVTWRISTELICFTVVVVVAGMSSSSSSSSSFLLSLFRTSNLQLFTSQ